MSSAPAPASSLSTLPTAEGRSTARNPGPSWGYWFLRLCDRCVPETVFRPLRGLGTAVALLGMPAQRRYSRDYLRLALGREPGWVELWRHFFAFEESLMLKLRVANGRPFHCTCAPGSDDFLRWLAEGHPVLLGTFHIGASDLMGFMIGGHEKRPVVLVRQRVGNSHDTEALAARFSEHLRFVWVNEPGELVFALRDAAATPSALALQCDRVEFSSRTAVFQFLGAPREFPITIYHLALIFDRPVLLSVGIQTGMTTARLVASPEFRRRPREPKAEALARAHAHFQSFLHQIDDLLRQQPYLWFNFLPLNPTEEKSPPPAQAP